MAIHPIVVYGEPVLHRKADPVVDFDDDLRSLVKMIKSREAGQLRIEQELADIAGRIRAELGRPVDDPEKIPQSDIEVCMPARC